MDATLITFIASTQKQEEKKKHQRLLVLKNKTQLFLLIMRINNVKKKGTKDMRQTYPRSKKLDLHLW